MSNNPFDRNRVREPKLGHIITEEGPETRRDAVHIAVIPMIADEKLHRGESVALSADGKRAFRRESWDSKTQKTTREGAVGIVDPFLTEDVEEGEKFWLFIFPGQVRTLQHYWTHPAFADEALVPQVPRSSREASEAWLRSYATRYMQYSSPEEGYKKLLHQMQTGTLCYEGTDMHSFGDLQEAEQLRIHAENVLGKKIDYGRFEYFTCSC